MDISKKIRTISIIALIIYFVIGATASVATLLTISQKIAIWEKTHRILPESYIYAVKTLHIFRIITYSIAIIGLVKLSKWTRIYVIILTIVVTIYDMVFAAIYVWPNLPNKNLFIMIAFISNTIWVGLIIFYFTRPKIKELLKGV